MYLSAVEYGDGTDDKPAYLPVKAYLYPKAVTSKDDPSRQTIEYVYTFHDASTIAQQLKTRTIIYAPVPTDQNGSGVPQTTAEYYDTSGRLRWTQDGEGCVNYYSYNANTGGLGYIMVDVKTDGLPGEITNGFSPNWIAWNGAAPFTHTDSNSLQLATRFEYDNLGRPVRAEDAEGMVTCTAYTSSQARVYPGWNASTRTCALPIRVTEANHDDLMTKVYTIDPAGVTIGYNNSNLPTGIDGGENQSKYITWTRYGYNTATAMLENVDRYHIIPSPASGDGAMSTNFSRTIYRYDALGRQTRTIQVISGTDAINLTHCITQITEAKYDKPGRVKAVYRGVGDANQPTLHKVAESFFDEAVPGNGIDGIGDGLTTSTLAYYDANHIAPSHAYKTVYHRNWRGQLRGIEPGAAPYVVQDVDNMGRVTAAAQYQANLTWPAVTGDDNFAATVASDAVTSAKRGSLAKTYYDNVNRVYRMEARSVAADTGIAGDTLVSDYYFDRNDRLVASYSPASGGLEYAYDGAGRQVEARAVVELAATKYIDAAFQYRNPQPGAATGGDDGVLRIARTEFNKIGAPTRDEPSKPTNSTPPRPSNAPR